VDDVAVAMPLYRSGGVLPECHADRKRPSWAALGRLGESWAPDCMAADEYRRWQLVNEQVGA
jgi:hypothetical protein